MGSLVVAVHGDRKYRKSGFGGENGALPEGHTIAKLGKGIAEQLQLILNNHTDTSFLGANCPRRDCTW